MLQLIKLPFKIIIFPIMAAFACMTFFFKLCSNISSYIFSPLILFVLGCLVYSLTNQLWNHVMILTAIELGCIAILFGSVFIETAFDWCYAILKGFVQS